MNFAFVFPGQGSQSVGMMAAYGESTVIRQAFAEASEALGEDLWQMVADGPAEVLAQTVNTQPLMLTAGVAVYREWIARGGALPSLVAGHSLGEFSALVAAGALSFEEGLRLVSERAHAMQKACEKFIRRFRYIEEDAAKRGRRLEDMSLEEMEEIYQEARHELEGKEPVPVEHRE